MAVPGQLINALCRSAGDVFTAEFATDGGSKQKLRISIADDSGRTMRIVVPANSSDAITIAVLRRSEIPIGIPPDLTPKQTAIQLLPTPPQLGTTERRLLPYITSTARPVKAIASAAGYKYNSHVTTSIKTLIALGLIIRTPKGVRLTEVH